MSGFRPALKMDWATCSGVALIFILLVTGRPRGRLGWDDLEVRFFMCLNVIVEFHIALQNNFIHYVPKFSRFDQMIE